MFCSSIIPVFDTIGVPPEKLDRWLIENRAYDSTQTWRDMFWLVNSIDNLPNEPEDGTSSSTPVDRNWRSPFVGKDIIDILDFLETIPESHREIVDAHYFIVLDQDLIDNGMVRCYRFKDWADEGDDFEDEECPDAYKNGVTFYSQQASHVALEFAALEGGDWEERIRAEWETNDVPDLEHSDRDWWVREQPRPNRHGSSLD